MKKTIWDQCLDMKTSSMLLAPTLEQHYEIFKLNFNDTDIILDVGCGDGSFSKHIPNSIGIDESTDLDSINLTKINTLHFSESIGYMDKETIEKYLSIPSIKKIVIKDFIYKLDEFIDTKFWSYDLRNLYRVVIPMLTELGFAFAITPFTPHKGRWHQILVKHGLPYIPYGGMNVTSVVLVANR
jgi:hypothetical protein